MPKITLYPDGSKCAQIGFINREPAKRGNARGWSVRSARANRDFLFSVDATGLQGSAVAASLTLGRDSLVDAETFKTLHDRFSKRMRRMGMQLLHWVIEFQTGGFPHIHAMMIFAEAPNEALCARIKSAWVEVAACSGASLYGQHVVATHAFQGWKKYLAKHGARSAHHYQRSGLPEGWENPGRVWGKTGPWPVNVSESWVPDHAFYAFRRQLRAWRIADARKEIAACGKLVTPRKQNAIRRLVAARRMLKCRKKEASAVRGCAEWVPDKVSARLLYWAAPNESTDWSERPHSEW